METLAPGFFSLAQERSLAMRVSVLVRGLAKVVPWQFDWFKQVMHSSSKHLRQSLFTGASVQPGNACKRSCAGLLNQVILKFST